MSGQSTRDGDNIEKAAAVIIGGGVVGCAVAHALARKGLQPILLEKGPRIAEGVTSRNSGVIHGGLYYQPRSLKAKLCVQGNAFLYEWCATHGVAHRKVGKWVVATSREDEEELENLYKNALASGARGISLHRFGVELPAGVQGTIGLRSSETGIVDPAELSFSLRSAAEEAGAMFLTSAEVQSIEPLSHAGFRVNSTRGEIDTEWVVNAAGLYADEVARMAGVEKYRVHPCRGDYFRVKTPQQFDTLVYPVKKKNAPGLGVHLTIGLDGSARLGPDAYYVASKDAFGDLSEKELPPKRRAFFEAASRYLNGVELQQLDYESCGIRPKLRAPQGEAEVDFVIAEDLPGLVNLVGIESPGLTASLAIAQHVATIVC